MIDIASERTDQVLDKQSPLDSKTAQTIDIAVSKSLAGRHVLMLAHNIQAADAVETALRGKGVDMQHLTTTDAGLRANCLDDDNGEPSFPIGSVIVLDSNTWSHSLKAQHISRATEAVINIVAVAGTNTVNHTLAITTERALAETAHTMNLLVDRMVKAQIVNNFGGPERISPNMRLFLAWMRPARSEICTVQTGQAANLLNNHNFTFGTEGWRDLGAQRSHQRHVIEHKRLMHYTYMLHNKKQEFHKIAINLPSSGYNSRTQNRAFNCHTGKTRRRR